MTLAFWKAVFERAIKTFAQAAVAQLGTGSLGITSLDWRVILSVSAGAALASVLTSLASLSTVTPSIVPDAPTESFPDSHALKALAASVKPVAAESAPASTFPAAAVEAALAAPVTVTPVFTPPTN